MVIRRRLGPGLSFAYVPWGPELPKDFPKDRQTRTVALAELANALKGFLPKNIAFIRFDPPWFSEGADAPPELGPPLIHASADVQAPDTVLVNLEGTKETLLARMKHKWRYNSRLALKRGVIIRRPDEKGLDAFYSLLRETARRDHISIHNFNYYKTLFSHCQEYQSKANSLNTSQGLPTIVPSLHLYTAEHEGEILAAIVVLFRGREAVYLYGASSNNKRNLMAPYALQVRAMLDAMEAGCKEYDLFGIPPKEEPLHPMAGLYRFKTGFGGRIIHRPGSWDYPCRPLAMKVFSFMESLRKKLRNRRKNRTEEQ
jgi:lipid II:glycine glycyltransferase (peptidoglycan interpeptide bridge formation enzyme)